MWIFFSFIAGVLLLGLYADRRQKKRRTSSHHTSSRPDANPGSNSTHIASIHRESGGENSGF
ncbi:hypothetical protein JMA_04320 [Jeotgalibacillus malaysiensis]|uniref:Uncharacterized protein n=1 Tax=Jeotgalibacillus malaysiensis TaxID=1508404 RepID=A0A0B5ANY7_9BACL|nr:hypothetical protein JMA_04320 [Jeotgalibacillus malaysiensis]